MILTSDGNKLGVNPQFVNPRHGNFHSRPARRRSTPAAPPTGSQSTDADGHPRVVGTVDIGAYEYGTGGGGTTNTAPVAKADSGFTTKAGVALTIDDAALLANDTDAERRHPVDHRGRLGKQRHGEAQHQRRCRLHPDERLHRRRELQLHRSPTARAAPPTPVSR